jgi:hypothetical protein
MDEACDDELNGYRRYDYDDGREENLGKTTFNSMIEGRNEKENEKKNEEGSEEGNGKKKTSVGRFWFLHYVMRT